MIDCLLLLLEEKSIKKLEHGNLIFHKNLKSIFNDLWRKRTLSMDNLTVKKVICSYLLENRDKMFENNFLHVEDLLPGVGLLGEVE